MIRSITDYLNTINEFLTDIKNYDIIILSKPDFDDEFTKIDSL